MKMIRKIEIFGDSILKGIQLNPISRRYHVNNNIDIDMLSEKFSLNIVNHSKLGCTVTKGKAVLDRYLDKTPDCTAILMDFGGNDCDFDWKSISENPDAEHQPNTPISIFIRVYTEIVDRIRSGGIRPVITNLPPIDSQRYFDWFCKGLCKESVLRWLGDVNAIYRYQELYSRTAEEIARNSGALLVDLRSVFLKEWRLDRYLCEDGIHPNTEGQKLLTQAFTKFCTSALA